MKMKVVPEKYMKLEEWRDNAFFDEEALEDMLPWETKDDIFYSAEIIDKILQYHGIIGYTGFILRLVETAYDISLGNSHTAF